MENVPSDGVLADLELENDAERCTYAEKGEWLAQHQSDLLFPSPDVVQAATADIPWIEYPGIYFLLFKGKVAYVGQAGRVGDRIQAHMKERRPFEAAAFILGLPSWILSEVEHAYIGAWSPPWNCERQRCGALRGIPDFANAARQLDATMVAPEYPARVTHARHKAWEIHVMGYMQAHSLK